MESLISIINKLQDVMPSTLFNSKVKLPQLVVVGSQSSGKSSIIESIVGKDFLPRGSGIVTRRPLILQLKNISKGKEWAEFNHLPKQRFEDFGRIQEEIEIETARIAGGNKGISSEPIILKIFSPDVIDLTLVDLPGLVKNPVGDQPKDIEAKVKSLILEYVSNPNALILAISPANNDIANSEALCLAREVDPHAQRTMGVITKIDIMDKGTSSDAVNILLNKSFPLKLGYIGVICRSQEDIKTKKPFEEAIKYEEGYFDSHEEYREVRHLLGNKVLKSTLSNVLIEHIRKSLPSIKELIYSELNEKEKEINALGSDPGFDRQDIVNSYILTLVSKFTHTYNEMIDGHFVRDCSKYFIGGARINFIFQEIFKKDINSIDPFNSLTDEDIRTAIKNSNGLKPSLFVPEAAFEVLIKQQIERFSQPSLMCVRKVYEELKNIVNFIDIPEIARFRKLENKIKLVMENVLDSCLAPTNQMIKNLIDIEKSYINTNHPDFMGSDQSIMNIFDENSPNNILGIANVNISGRGNDSNSNINNNLIANSYGSFSGAGNNYNNNVSNGNGNFNSGYKNNYNKNPNSNNNNSYTGNTTNNTFNNNNNNEIEEENKYYSSSNNSKKKSKESEDDGLTIKKGEEKRNFGGGEIHNIPSQMRPGIPTNRDLMETMIIKNLISSYYHVVKKNINDLVPKTIMCFLVNQSKIMAEKEMVSQLYKSAELDSLLHEDPNIAKKRKNCKDTLQNLKKSLEILSDFNDFSSD
jgi:dynamin 1-like protein